jgi:hypothetical protein
VKMSRKAAMKEADAAAKGGAEQSSEAAAE